MQFKDEMVRFFKSAYLYINYNSDLLSDIVLLDIKSKKKDMPLYVSLGGARHKISYL
jgi:hypothetical protein